MKREKALQIATNFYTFRMGSEPVSMTVKYEDPKDGRVVLVAADHDIEEDEEVLYEIEINPMADSITMKKILCEFSASHFMQGTKQISELRQGDQFRLSGDCLVYEFCGSEFRFGCTRYMVRPTTGRGTQWISADVEVWPCK
jgi:hypothetical protein|uniref:Uncharacterized protein n=1 Tax=Siphoviridae sp. ctcUB23 TaxID=2825573 RepID=A0A8S5PKS4_9CAUD|nr:MAG TPA: hypothetical protein [Siphoviridae sp. ctcUB23]